MMWTLHMLVLCVFSYVADVIVYNEDPRQEDNMMVGCRGITVNFTKKTTSPEGIYYAASFGNLQYIDDEISRLGPSGLNLDRQNPIKDGWTALHASVEQNMSCIVSTLLRAGASPNIQEDYGRSPLHIAAYYNNIGMLQLLLDPKYQADVNLAENDGWTPVFWAASMGQTAALEVLLTKGGADPNKVSTSGSSPLISASSNGDLASASVLIEAGAYINYANPSDGYTALHLAAWEDNTTMALLLLDKGADKSKKDNWGRTPAKLSRKFNNGLVARVIKNY